MSHPSLPPSSNNRYAPDITYYLYLTEKGNFSGIFVGAILYGITIVLFLRCMSSLLHRKREDINWGIVAHAAAMFTLTTISFAMQAYIQYISFICNRNFPPFIDGVPGPYGYMLSIFVNPIYFTSYLTLILNNWLSNGLLLYRCWAVYAKSHKAVALPCLLLIGSFVSGTLFAYRTVHSDTIGTDNVYTLDVEALFLSLSVALPLLLTFMISTRLILHRRNLQKSMGGGASVGGLYKAIVTIFVESYSIDIIFVIIFVGTWGAQNGMWFVSLPVITQTQVIAPLLVALRIAKRGALMNNNTIPSTNIGSSHYRSQGTQARSGETLTYGYRTTFMDPSELGIGVETNNSEDFLDL